VSEKHSKQNDPSRRRFLKGMVVGGSVAGLAGGSSVMAATQTSTPSSKAGAEPTQRKGYQETAHIRRFYDLARG
jgi:hypothetical protein